MFDNDSYDDSGMVKGVKPKRLDQWRTKRAHQDLLVAIESRNFSLLKRCDVRSQNLEGGNSVFIEPMIPGGPTALEAVCDKGWREAIVLLASRLKVQHFMEPREGRTEPLVATVARHGFPLVSSLLTILEKSHYAKLTLDGHQAVTQAMPASDRELWDLYYPVPTPGTGSSIPRARL